jgi:hypothetical protein
MIDDANTHYIDGNKRLNNMHQGPFDIARQWRRGFCATLVALPAIIVPLWIMTCELGPTDRYIVPLCDHYILQSPASSEREFASLGPFQLEKVSKGADLLSWESYIPDYTVISTRPTSDALPWWDPSFKAPPFRISGLLPNVVRIGFDDHNFFPLTPTATIQIYLSTIAAKSMRQRWRG